MELELELDPGHEPKPTETTPAPVAASGTPNEPVKFDRRRRNRPVAPSPGVILALQLKTDKLAKLIFISRSRAMLFIGAQLICLAIIAWSLGVRYTGLESTDVMENEMFALQTQLDGFKSQWSQADLKQIETSLSSAENRVFVDYTSFAAWLRDKAEYASRLGLSMSYRIGQKDKTSLTDTLSLPVHMTLKIQDAAADNAYVRALEFVRSLIDENLRLEVFGNEIKADREGISSVDLSINVWVHAKDAGDEVIEPGMSAGSGVSDDTFIQ